MLLKKVVPGLIGAYLGVALAGTTPAQEAVKEPGLFANQNSACRLRDEHTLTVLIDRFGLAEEGA